MKMKLLVLFSYAFHICFFFNYSNYDGCPNLRHPTQYTAADFRLIQSLVVNRTIQAYILVNLFHDDRLFRLNLHIKVIILSIIKAQNLFKSH